MRQNSATIDDKMSTSETQQQAAGHASALNAGVIEDVVVKSTHELATQAKNCGNNKSINNASTESTTAEQKKCSPQQQQPKPRRIPAWKRKKSPSLRATKKRSRANLATALSVAEATAKILAAPRIVIFTGAGISVSAGLSTFSTPGGLYDSAKEKFNLKNGIDAFAFKFLQTSRANCQRFLMSMLEEVQHATPTTTHEGIAKLHHTGKLMRHYTLNIDRLHEMVGMDTWNSENLPNGSTVMMHGNIFEAVCSENGHVYEVGDQLQWRLAKGRAVKCSKDGCGSILRPRVMMYQEEEDEIISDDYSERLEDDLENADLILWVGLSFEQAATLNYFRQVYRELADNLNQRRREMQGLRIGDVGPQLQQPLQIVVNPSDVTPNIYAGLSGVEKLRLASVTCKSDELFGALLYALDIMEGKRPLPGTTPRSDALPKPAIDAPTSGSTSGDSGSVTKVNGGAQPGIINAMSQAQREKLIRDISTAAAAAVAPAPPVVESNADTVNWACCHLCNKWRIVNREYGDEEQFQCRDVKKDCTMPEDVEPLSDDESDEVMTAETNEERALNWATCTECNKRRIVLRAYRNGERFSCMLVNKHCDQPEDTNPASDSAGGDDEHEDKRARTSAVSSSCGGGGDAASTERSSSSDESGAATEAAVTSHTALSTSDEDGKR